MGRPYLTSKRIGKQLLNGSVSLIQFNVMIPLHLNQETRSFWSNKLKENLYSSRRAQLSAKQYMNPAKKEEEEED